MKQRKLVVERIQVQQGLFRSSKERQPQKTGSYTVTTSLACFQWLLRYIISRPIKLEKEKHYHDIIRNTGQKKRSFVIHHIYILITPTLLLTYNKNIW